MDEKALIQSSLNGDKKSLELLIRSVQEKVFNLALRFLWKREDAEDATQEVLLKVITNLGRFQGNSKFSTWVYRIATNHLINQKQTQLERTLTSFDVFAQDLAQTHHASSYDAPDLELLQKELKTGCTLAMLQCLDRKQRVAFILGSVLKIKSTIAAEIVDTTPANFRKRLETSRKKINAFLNQNCGVYNPSNPCRCNKRINGALSCGRIAPTNLNFVGNDKVEPFNQEMEELNAMEGIYQNHGKFISQSDFTQEIQALIATKSIVYFDNGTKA